MLQEKDACKGIATRWYFANMGLAVLGAAVIPGFDPESVAHEQFFGKLMNHGRLWRGGAAVAVVGELVEPQAMERVRAPRNPGTA